MEIVKARTMHCHTVDVPNCGKLKVFVQGERRPGKTGFLTVHDIGSNHKSFVPLVEHKAMHDLVQRTVWIHVCLPGQGDNDEDLPEAYRFPTLDQIADDLVFLLNKHYVPSVIGIGDGAGANIMSRFGLRHPKKCLGLVLINCDNNASNSNGFSLQMKILSVKKSCGKLFRKFSAVRKNSMLEHSAGSSNSLNINNVMHYWNSHNDRSDISSLYKKNTTINILLVVGQHSKHLDAVRDINSYNLTMQLMVILDGTNPLSDSPTELIRALILFCKGCGVLLDVPMIGLENEYHRVKEHKPPTAVQLQIVKKVQQLENLLGDSDEM